MLSKKRLQYGGWADRRWLEQRKVTPADKGRCLSRVHRSLFNFSQDFVQATAPPTTAPNPLVGNSANCAGQGVRCGARETPNPAFVVGIDGFAPKKLDALPGAPADQLMALARVHGPAKQH